jgi:hypothetical protein
MPTSTLRFPQLPKPKLAALRRRAERDGLTPEQYVKRLIEEDLRRTDDGPTFAVLAKPFEQAYGHLTDAEIDQIVKEARGSRASVRLAFSGAGLICEQE